MTQDSVGQIRKLIIYKFVSGGKRLFVAQNKAKVRFLAKNLHKKSILYSFIQKQPQSSLLENDYILPKSISE